MPYHLRVLAGVGDEIQLEVDDPVTLGTMLDALEAEYPMLRGTIRDHVSKQRRPLLRYFACGVDLSHEPADTLLPEAIRTGSEALWIIGAIAGG